MKKLREKKINLFGKKVSVFVIVIMSLALVSAALLTYYGVITGMAVVSQSVIVEDSPITGAWDTSLVAGTTVVDCDTDQGEEGSGHSVKNNADVEAPVQFGTTCRNVAGTDDGVQYESYIDWADGIDSPECDGIVTEIYGVLKLTSKNVVFGQSPWTETADMKATVKYTIVGDEFSAEVIDSEGEWNLDNYVLVYYSDNIDRFTNPSVAIKVEYVDENLPYADDENVDEYNYCGDTYEEGISTGDNYEHCHGAKIWYVPASALTDNEDGTWAINWGQASNFLFETDLIMYSDDTGNVMDLLANGGGFNFCESNAFALNLVPDTYTIRTEIQPVTTP